MNYVEKYLYDYKANVAELQALREELNDLVSLHGQSYESFNPSGEADPVANTVNRKIKLEKKIAVVEKRVKPVMRLIEDLKGSSICTSQMANILKLRYIQHEDKLLICRNLAISEATFWRRVRQLVKLAKRYFGKFVIEN